MHRTAPMVRRRRALGRAPATPTSSRCGRRAPAWLAALALAALSVAFSGASAQAGTDRLAERLRKLDPGALVGGNSIVGTSPGQQLGGVRGRPNLIAALGDGETIRGAAKNDQLGAIGRDATIVAPAEGHSQIVAGPGSKVIVSGQGHNLIYSHAGGATIMLKSPGNEVIADGLGDKILCDAHASDERIRVATAVKVSKSCERHDNTIEPAPEAPLRRVASPTVTGSGTNEDPYQTDRCDEYGPSLTCIARFPARTLTGFWAHEYVPAYLCPSERPWLVNQFYAPLGTRLPAGVEVEGLGPVGVSISATWPAWLPYATAYARGTLTGYPHSSATNWTLGTASYRVILHCTSEPSLTYYSLMWS
jgi:hypothetical protein